MGYNAFLFLTLDCSSTFSSDGTKLVFCSVEMVLQVKSAAITDADVLQTITIYKEEMAENTLNNDLSITNSPLLNSDISALSMSDVICVLVSFHSC